MRLQALILAASLLAAGAAHADAVRDCTSDDATTGAAPETSEVASHRLFDVAPISYTKAAKDQIFGLTVKVLVGEDGSVVCLQKEDTPFSQDSPATPERTAYRSVMAAWSYQPFLVDGQPARVYVEEYVPEQILPATHVDMPPGDLSDTSVTLERDGCFGTCPSYSVTVHGDGGVDYTGGGFVDIDGQHHYQIPPGEAAALIERLRARDLWSMQPQYVASITDSATYTLTIVVAGQSKVIVDYVGGMVGMPAAIGEAEADVDSVAHVDGMIHLSMDGLKVLEDEHFPFVSQAGADLLARATADHRAHDDALAALVGLGAPVEGGKANIGWGPPPAAQSLLSVALVNRHAALVDPLIARGALQTAGKPDQAKIDAAFRDAIVGGRLAPVQRLWQEAGATAHPALTFTDTTDDPAPSGGVKPAVTAPVTLLLARPWNDNAWEGADIAKWLIAQGCDAKAHGADGRTLLHIAAAANSADFVRYLLDLGMDPSTPGRYGLPALGSTQSEDVALILLSAGTTFTTWEGGVTDFRNYAKNNDWKRVLAWLDAHPPTK